MMNKKLYIGNLLYEVTDDQLRDQFSQAGTVVSAQVIRFADTGRSKGFGFVEMSSDEEAQKAVEMFNEQDLNGRKMIVNEARPPGERRPRFGGGGGGGFGGGNRSGGFGGGDRRPSGGGGGRRFNNNNRDNRENRDRGNYGQQNDYGQQQHNDYGQSQEDDMQ
ncbi:hypothetical protein BH09PAT2_BH09PAT2_02350 [soil metagenome]